MEQIKKTCDMMGQVNVISIMRQHSPVRNVISDVFAHIHRIVVRDGATELLEAALNPRL